METGQLPKSKLRSNYFKPNLIKSLIFFLKMSNYIVREFMNDKYFHWKNPISYRKSQQTFIALILYRINRIYRVSRKYKTFLTLVLTKFAKFRISIHIFYNLFVEWLLITVKNRRVKMCLRLMCMLKKVKILGGIILSWHSVCICYRNFKIDRPGQEWKNILVAIYNFW